MDRVVTFAKREGAATDAVLKEQALRVAVVCDLREENWPSMDLVADSVLRELGNGHFESVSATRILPAMRRRLTNNGDASGKRFNADRLLNRFRDYPRTLRKVSNDFDVFHIVDHSYAQLVHELPAERTVVTCHDLDTFRCLIEPEKERRSPLFKAMARRVMKGMQRAARLTCDSAATRDAILTHKIVEPDRLVVIPNGVHPAFSSASDLSQDAEIAKLLGPVDETTIDFLHVGSTIERKRIDTLLKVFAEVRKEFSRARLIRAGGSFTSEQSALAAQLGIADSIVVVPHLDTAQLAAVYRRAALLLLTSEREGFGLPVIEAMASGTPVVASDLPVLREVAENAATFVPFADIEAWRKALVELINERATDSVAWERRVESGIRQSAKFSWAEYARRMVDVYREVAATR